MIRSFNSRKFVIGAVLAASTFVAAAPAAAQYYPQQQAPPYGTAPVYNAPYGNGYSQSRSLVARVDLLGQQIRQMSRQGLLPRDEAYRLASEAQQLRARVRQQAYNGINPNERFELERRVARLEQRVQMSGNGRTGRGYGFGQNGQYGNGQYGYNQNGQYGQNGYANQDGRWQGRDGNWHDRDDRRDDDRRDR